MFGWTLYIKGEKYAVARNYERVARFYRIALKHFDAVDVRIVREVVTAADCVC